MHPQSNIQNEHSPGFGSWCWDWQAGMIFGGESFGRSMITSHKGDIWHGSLRSYMLKRTQF